MNDPGEDASNFLRDLGNAASRNPISAALIGMGALLLLSGRALKSEAARPMVRRASEALGPASEGMRSRIGSAASSWQDFDADKGMETIADLRSSLTEIFQRQPLALGAIGLAIGAGIAAALPLTEAETELMGETSAEMKEKAQEFAAEQADRAKEVAERVVDAAAEEARNQGFSQEGIKSTAKDVSAKLERVFDAAKEGFSDRAKVPQ